MKTTIVKGELSKLLKQAYYEGERQLLKTQEGEQAALVPIEDLQLLEEIEGSYIS